VNMDVLPTGGGTVPLLGSAGIDTFNRGNKFFELANHLGNVLVTVSDRKIGQSPVNNLYTSFTADVVSATDYAPFGMQMVGRSFDAAGSTAYRYGFNGQEKTPEVSSSSFTAEYWQYDARIARRWNVDPVRKESLSGYSVNGLNPIWYMDRFGDDWFSNEQGMFIWAADPSIMLAGFKNYHGTELPEGVSKSQILTTVVGQPGFYYQYKSDGIGKFANWINGLLGYSTQSVALKKYSWHDVALGTEFRDIALMGVLAKMASPLAQSVMGMLKKSGGSIWKLASWVERGFIYEASQGANLAKNYPVIDKFLNGVATSIKTLDFNMSTYAKNSKAIYNTLKGYIDKLAEFKGANVGGVNTIDQIEKKILNVGIPKGANKEQVSMFNQAVEYAKSLNIELQLNVVK